MKVTSTDPFPSPLATQAANSSAIGGIGVSGPALPGQGLLSNSSNTATWQPVVSTVTSNGSNALLGPNVNLEAGANISFAVNSNTLTITGSAGGGSVSYGSNSNDVGPASAPGVSTLVSRADHVHRGVTSLSHSSNTFTGPVTLTTPGNSVGITSPTPGTLAFTSTGSGGGGSSIATDASGTLVQSIAWTTVADAGTKVFGAAPTDGNTCYAFIVTNVVSVVSLVETNVTWTKIAKARVRNGNNMVLEIWKGVVAASASATITFDFDGNNVQGVLIQEWSGLGTVDAIQAALVNQTNVLQIENHNLAWSTPGGRAFLLWGNATGGAPATPPGWTASTGTPFNYGGTGYGSLYSIDASAIASLTATAYLPAVANDNITAILLHAKPTVAAAAVAYWPMLSLTSG